MAGTNFLNYISNFFFISLAITFILIVFLIYHYKQRIAGIEQKVETMFGLVSSVVKEMENIKGVINNMFSSPPSPQAVAGSFMPKPLDIMPTIPEVGSLRNSLFENTEDEDDDDDDDDDEEDEDDDDDDEDDDDEDMPPLEKIVINTTLSPEEEQLIASIDTFDIDESKLEEPFEHLEDDAQDEDDHVKPIESVEPIESIESSQITIENVEPVESQITIENVQQHEPAAAAAVAEQQQQPAPLPTSTFSKLSIGELKKLANQIQPSLDVSKMKKQDLIKLLDK